MLPRQMVAVSFLPLSMSLSCFLFLCCWQVHGSDAEAASKQLSWSQMPTLVLEAAKMPLLWYFAVAGFSCEHLARPFSVRH